MLKLMYITNRPEIAQIAETAGADRIFVDMEFLGKDERQKGLDTVKSHHTLGDVAAIKAAVVSAEVLVRVNPIHDALPNYMSSKEEIDATVAAGADIIMLPYFKTVGEVETFLRLVGGRTKTMLLVETPEAVEHIDEIIQLPGIDEVYIGLNDLSLGYGKKFMFELLADGTVEQLCFKLRQKGIFYGFGGIASLGNGMLPSEYVIKEHYRLGSRCVILSRSFCDVTKIKHIGIINATFLRGVREIRELEQECEKHSRFFFDSEEELVQRVKYISKGMNS
jgi:Citrate lyase beta subunit